mgnify:CR=1 FL=1
MRKTSIRLVMTAATIAAIASTLVAAPPATAATAHVVLNEIACEGTDQVELANTGDATADLSGWLLTDKVLSSTDATHRYLFASGTSLAPGAHLVVEKAIGGFPFGISCGDDTIRLADSTASAVDDVVLPDNAADPSLTYGRLPDGTGDWTWTMPTVGAANQPTPDDGASLPADPAWLYDPLAVLNSGFWLSFGAVAAILWELRNAWNAHRSVKRIDEALEDIETEGPSPRVPRSHLVVPPIAFVTRGVRRTRGIKYAQAEDGTNLRLDIYRPADDDPGDDILHPAVIQVHGGGWLAGSRFEQGIPLLNHLASIGWVGFNVDYRLSPEATWPAQITDVKRAIAWVRENAAELGIDPEMICITGGSAGGHLTALAGLTANAPEFQPGFEDADTSLAAAVPFYGVYDLTNANGHYYSQLNDWVFEKVLFKVPLAGNEELYRSASPMHRINAEAPPFLVIHGERDTLVPVGDARDFVEAMRATSKERVLYVELPDAEHAFDLWPSERTARIKFRLVACARTRALTAGACRCDARNTRRIPRVARASQRWHAARSRAGKICVLVCSRRVCAPTRERTLHVTGARATCDARTAQARMSLTSAANCSGAISMCCG